MKKYKNLIAALYPYRGDLDLDNLQRFNWLKDNIESKHIDVAELKNELKNALLDPHFDWVLFAKEHLLIVEDSFSSTEIAQYVKSILSKYLEVGE